MFQYQKIHFYLMLFLAVAVVFVPLLMASWFALCPEYGNVACPQNTGVVIHAYRVAPHLLLQIFLSISLILAYISPLLFVGLGIVTGKYSPIFTAIAIVFGWIGSIVPWGLIFTQTIVYVSMSQLHTDTTFVSLENVFAHNPYIIMSAVGWGLHLLGYLFFGIALLRTPVVSKWVGILFIFATFAMGPIAYGTGQNIIQVSAYVVVALAGFPVAGILIRNSAQK